MSYRRTYRSEIAIKYRFNYRIGDKTGYEDVTIREPINVTIDVDTDSFDRSIDQCNVAVGGLASAVVATEAAQVKSKRESSMKIANSIIKGFFTYVSAELSQKMKELASQCESLFAALMEYSASCLSKRGQMQDDYNRITKRYAKIFDDLDKETVSRIEALDGTTFKFAEISQKLVNKSIDSQLLGLAAIAGDENVRLETVLSCSHMKKQANLLVERTNDYLVGTYRLANSVREMLDDSVDADPIHVPVIYLESVSSPEEMQSEVVTAEYGAFLAGEPEKNSLLSKFKSDRLKWGRMGDREMDRVISYFNEDIQQGNIDERVANMMSELMNNNEIEIIKA